jgi:O-acetyl-ADP-ribose deacetylase (regulator of RNase III)
MQEVIGDITDSSADCIVSAANCVGVMGKGVAKAIKSKFPWSFPHYKSVCERKGLQPGGLLALTLKVYPLEDVQTIIHLATKEHWRNPSKLEWVVSGCNKLKQFLEMNQIKSVAIPRLGCGLGGLSWDIVKPEMEEVFSGIDCEIMIFEKGGSN